MKKVNTVRVNGVNTAGQIAVSAVKGNGVTAVKASAVDVQDMDGGFVAFGGSARGGKITGKGKIRTDKLDFEDVFFVNELKFNLFSISQMCDKKNNVLFTEIECLVLSSDFKLLDESQVLLRVPNQTNMYNFDLKNVVPSGDLTCLFAKSTINKSKSKLQKSSLCNKSSDEADEDDTADEAAGETPLQKLASENEQALKNVLDKMMDQEKEAKEQSDDVRKDTLVNIAGGSIIFGDVGSSFVPLIKFTNLPHDPLMPDLKDTTEVPNTSIFGSAYDDDDLYTCNSPYADQVVVAEADFNNMEFSTIVSPIPTTRVHSIHPKDQIIGDRRSIVQTRGITKKSSREHAMISYIQKQRRSNHKDFQN
ncbi:hypothetical protein Tco_1019226 [Tanacetum coccineum]|uniref:Uncharacterized protein n=1 Tax=Tanacetum coccineum TaxID=301880 RepID=A0ABQ5FWI1_9ASTR